MSCFESIEEMREKCICLNLRPVTRLMTRRYDEAYASTALRSTQVPILFFLMLNGETQMDALGDEMAMDKSTLSRNFRLLEARGLVSRSDIDGRTVGASITAAGQAALEPVCDIWRDIQGNILNGVGMESWLSALGVLRKMAGQ